MSTPSAAQYVAADTSGFAEIRASIADGQGRADQDSGTGFDAAHSDAVGLNAALAAIERRLPAVIVGSDREVTAEALLLLGQTHQARGELGDALTAYERAQLFADQSGEVAAQARAYRGLGKALRVLGRYQEAAVHFGAAAQFFEEGGDIAAQTAMYRAQSRAYLLAERGEQARAAALTSARTAEAADLVPEQAEGLRLLAAVGASLEDYSAAYEALRQADALQESRLEARIAAERTQLEQRLLDALALREADRDRTDEQVRDLIEAEHIRWRRQLALTIGALTLGAVGVALLLWGAGSWRRRRHRYEVKRHKRTQSRTRQKPSSHSRTASSGTLRLASAGSEPDEAAREGTVTALAAPPLADVAVGLAEGSEPGAEEPSAPATTNGGVPPTAEVEPTDPAATDPAVTDAVVAEAALRSRQLTTAAATAPEGFSPRPAALDLAGQAEAEETGLALAALLLDQQLGAFAGDGLASVDRGRVLGRAEVLRMLRHRVLRQGVEIDMQGFFEALRDYVLLRRGSLATGIEIVVVAPMPVRVRHAAPLGLIAYELLINAVEHAFVGRRDGRIDVHVHQDGEHLTLNIADDGRGLPAGFSLERSGGEGLAFVRSLAGYLRAAVEVRSATGTRWGIHVPLGTGVQPPSHAAP